MRRADESAALDPAQAAVAETGVKAMIPIGRPFLDYVLSALRESGYERVCLVIGPEHSAVREHYTRVAPAAHLELAFAVQEKPLGTADAVLAAEAFTDGEPFIVLNSDNYYPAEALRRLRDARPPALIGFARTALIEAGNVPPDRVGRFGALEVDAAGHLVSITPRNGMTPQGGREVLASMNCWLFDERIFDACRRVPMSPRGELELPRAVQMAVDELGMEFTVIPVSAPVLDMSTRADIARVKALLERVAVEY